VVFPDAELQQAVNALGQLQREGEEHFAKSGCEAKLNIKAHIGSAICARVGTKTDKRFDVFGDAVNFTARLPGDGLVLSDKLQEAIAS
jgi:class 3 adenylate cyclase